MEIATNVVAGCVYPKENENTCSVEDFNTFLENCSSYAMISSPYHEFIETYKGINNASRLFVILADMYAATSLSNPRIGIRQCQYGAKQWANWLNCSTSTIFEQQKKLESEGLFHIIKGTDEDNWNEKNIIISTLPPAKFETLSNQGQKDINAQNCKFEETKNKGCYRAYLDTVNLKVKFNIHQVKLLLSDNNLKPLDKLIWLYCHRRSHYSYMNSDGTTRSRDFTVTHDELAKQLSCGKNKISESMRRLSQHGYLSLSLMKRKDENKQSQRRKIVVWRVTTLFPKDKMDFLLANHTKDKEFANIRAGVDNQANLKPLFLNSDTQNPYSDTQNPQIRYNNNKNTTLNFVNIKNLSCAPASSQNETPDTGFFESITKEDIAKANLNVDRFMQHISNNSATAKHEQLDEIFDNHDLWLNTKVARYFYLQWQGKINDDTDEFEAINKFSRQEQYLISLWRDDLDEIPEEVVIRKSWYLALTHSTIVLAKDLSKSKESSVDEKVDVVEVKHQQNMKKIGSNNARLAKRYAKKLCKDNLRQGDSKLYSEENLIRQFVHFAAEAMTSWQQGNTADEKIRKALNFAYRAVTWGSWQCPTRWSQATDLLLKQERVVYGDPNSKEYKEFKQEIQKYLSI